MEIKNISLDQQLATYKELMHSLIYEKPTMTSEKKAQKEEVLVKLAKEKFTIDGENDFKIEIDEYINNILSIKPGRKLIKALLKTDQKIRVIKSNAFRCNETGVFIGVFDRGEYTTVGNRSFRRPTWIIFAHELIHALHIENCSKEFGSKIWSKQNIIERMDNLEEQITIVGFDEAAFSTNGIKSKLDILCENAFLLALGLPPRIDHHGGYDDGDFDWEAHKDDFTLDPYCAWLDKALNSIKQIPVEKSDDKEFILKFLYQHPIAASTLSEKLKNDEEFMLELISDNVRLLKQFPKHQQNKDFMLKLIAKHDLAMIYLTPELLNEKEFVIKCLGFADGDETFLEIIYEKITGSLKEDPDIKKIFAV